MRCKKCNSELTYDSKFCPYCGESIGKVDDTYEDPFKDLRINSHESQYNYQNKYSDNKSKKLDQDLIPHPSDNKSLIGLILSIIAVISSIFNIYIGIPIAVIGLILTIRGIKSTKKGFGILALILSIFMMISTIIITVFMIVGNIVFSFSNGYKTTIKDYFTDAFLCGLNVYRVEGYWIDKDNHVLYLDDGNYYFYLDNEDLIDNYYYGYYDIEGGIELKEDESFFSDGNYYYYQINTSNNKLKLNGDIKFQDPELLSKIYTLKLDKKTKENLILILDKDKEIEFTKR